REHQPRPQPSASAEELPPEQAREPHGTHGGEGNRDLGRSLSQAALGLRENGDGPGVERGLLVKYPSSNLRVEPDAALEHVPSQEREACLVCRLNDAPAERRQHEQGDHEHGETHEAGRGRSPFGTIAPGGVVHRRVLCHRRRRKRAPFSFPGAVPWGLQNAAAPPPCACSAVAWRVESRDPRGAQKRPREKGWRSRRSRRASARLRNAAAVASVSPYTAGRYA